MLERERALYGAGGFADEEEEQYAYAQQQQHHQQQMAQQQQHHHHQQQQQQQQQQHLAAQLAAQMHHAHTTPTPTTSTSSRPRPSRTTPPRAGDRTTPSPPLPRAPSPLALLQAHRDKRKRTCSPRPRPRTGSRPRGGRPPRARRRGGAAQGARLMDSAWREAERERCVRAPCGGVQRGRGAAVHDERGDGRRDGRRDGRHGDGRDEQPYRHEWRDGRDGRGDGRGRRDGAGRGRGRGRRRGDDDDDALSARPPTCPRPVLSCPVLPYLPALLRLVSSRLHLPSPSCLVASCPSRPVLFDRRRSLIPPFPSPPRSACLPHSASFQRIACLYLRICPSSSPPSPRSARHHPQLHPAQPDRACAFASSFASVTTTTTTQPPPTRPRPASRSLRSLARRAAPAVYLMCTVLYPYLRTYYPPTHPGLGPAASTRGPPYSNSYDPPPTLPQTTNSSARRCAAVARYVPLLPPSTNRSDSTRPMCCAVRAYLRIAYACVCVVRICVCAPSVRPSVPVCIVIVGWCVSPPTSSAHLPKGRPLVFVFCFVLRARVGGGGGK
ncbi:hypothetical protein HYPSUDRAFT_975728 [Hypholoma sublateritium FD-334 SS-4]|uniref:Uncharacterized protein n=1 Tax=Hypholoma sublateritium (strain FD-334 SS-4) TaxID=945553 RepID=A0A0D2NMG1_HYPSF|nr:hypothetical protein HYPSUDRAFT_975728 [Hypholoma sublateritium FD-334 SS-4]